MALILWGRRSLLVEFHFSNSLKGHQTLEENALVLLKKDNKRIFFCSDIAHKLLASRKRHFSMALDLLSKQNTMCLYLGYKLIGWLAGVIIIIKKEQKTIGIGKKI